MIMEVLSCTLSKEFAWSGGSEVFIKRRQDPNWLVVVPLSSTGHLDSTVLYKHQLTFSS